jgi:hypothetical protein
MARPMTETTKSIVDVLTKNPAITYNEAVDQGLINPEQVPVARFNVTKHNFTHGKIVALSGSPAPKATKRKVPAVPKAKPGRKAATPAATGTGRKTYRQYKAGSGPVRTLVNVPPVGDLSAAMKAVADAGGLAKAKAVIAQADALRAAVAAVENAQATLAKIA